MSVFCGRDSLAGRDFFSSFQLTSNSSVLLYPVMTPRAVTAEAAGSSPVVPVIHAKRVAKISVKPSRTQKGTFRDLFCVPFRSLFPPQGFVRLRRQQMNGDCGPTLASCEKTKDSTAACALYLAGVITCV